MTMISTSLALSVDAQRQHLSFNNNIDMLCSPDAASSSASSTSPEASSSSTPPPPLMPPHLTRDRLMVLEVRLVMLDSVKHYLRMLPRLVLSNTTHVFVISTHSSISCLSIYLLHLTRPL
jgi:hypothetical protein